jgi:hypothetical protein
VGKVVTVTYFMSAAAMLIATIYFLWSGLVERVLHIRHAFAALGITAAFGLAWSIGLPGSGVDQMLWFALLILMLCVLAPWAHHRVRHG